MSQERSIQPTKMANKTFKRFGFLAAMPTSEEDGLSVTTIQL
jgi:hypothetical protein